MCGCVFEMFELKISIILMALGNKPSLDSMIDMCDASWRHWATMLTVYIAYIYLSFQSKWN